MGKSEASKPRAFCRKTGISGQALARPEGQPYFPQFKERNRRRRLQPRQAQALFIKTSSTLQIGYTKCDQANSGLHDYLLQLKGVLKNEDFCSKSRHCDKFYRRHIDDIPRIKF
jgi:hypothetical protein